MARYKPVDRNPKFIPVVLSEQIQPGTFEFTLDHLIDHELDLLALDARFKNDQTGVTAYDPRVMLKIVLLAYSRGLISSRAIERACQQNVQFMALSGDAAPSYAPSSYTNQPSPHPATEAMKRAINSEHGRCTYRKRRGTVEPVFANLRHNKQLNRFTLRGRCKVGTQWQLYCMVHNIEKIANR
jgi:transposase